MYTIVYTIRSYCLQQVEAEKEQNKLYFGWIEPSSL